ncbi:iron complex outermembrane recepter protein [Spirosomataceae bacterium TFI 002]|nr:iron complex outermembrane recepter protein [Spirosomataceae bacterium TFI 002]
MKNLLLLVGGVLLLCLITITNTTAQRVQLMDENSNEPISFASFQYGNQIGYSDDLGRIDYKYLKETQMKVSHINYGSWEIESDILQKGGVASRAIQLQNLYPTTVIALRLKSSETKDLKLTLDDNLSHDATSVLLRNPLFSSIQKSGGYGFDPVMRGFKYDQLNIVLNGAQGATAACPNRMDPPTSQLAPNTISKVEVIKGPYGLRYGTGLGATINFISEPLLFSSENRLNGRVSTSYETNGNLKRTEARIGHVSEKLNLNVFGAWSQGDDYLAGDGKLVQADFERGSLGGDIGLRISKNQNLKLSAIRNLARDTDFAALGMDLRKDDTWLLNADHNINFENSLFKTLHTTAYLSKVNHLMDNLLKPLDPRMMNASTLALSQNYGMRTEGKIVVRNIQGYIGADTRIETTEGIREREMLMGSMKGMIMKDNPWQESQLQKSGIFGEFTWYKNGLRLVAATRFEAVIAQMNAEDEAFVLNNAEWNATQLNPNASVGMLKNLNKGVSLGLWIARAQRSASISERFINYFSIGQDPYELLGNPSLSPEINNQADLTFEWRTKKVLVNLDVFASYLNDYISSVIDPTLKPKTTMSPGVRRFVNLGDAFKTGFEFSWTQQFNKQFSHGLATSYTYGQNLESGEALPEIAPMDVRYNLGGEFFDGTLRTSIVLRYVAKQGRIATEYGETETPSFSTVGLNCEYLIMKNLSVSAKVLNLFNQNYYEHLSRSVASVSSRVYAKGRTSQFALNWSF